MYHAGFSSLDIALIHGYDNKEEYKKNIENQEGKSLIHIIRDLDMNIGPLLEVDASMYRNRIHAIKDELLKAKTLWEQVEACARCHLSLPDICNFVNMSLDALDKKCKKDNKRSIEDYIKHFKIMGKKRLLEAQFDAAENGSDRMLAHLGENYIEEQKPIVKDNVINIDNRSIKYIELPKPQVKDNYTQGMLGNNLSE